MQATEIFVLMTSGVIFWFVVTAVPSGAGTVLNYTKNATAEKTSIKWALVKSSIEFSL
jgi:hypothetical protein